MFDLLKCVQPEINSIVDSLGYSIVEHFSSFLLEEYPELFTNLCYEIRSSKYV